MMDMKKNPAFSFVELMLVIIILGILTAVVIPRLSGRSDEAKIKVAQIDVRTNIPLSLKLYRLDNGKFPANDEGLATLFTRPAQAKNWKGPYFDKKPTDPWGRAYQYKYPGLHQKDGYDLYSLGKDGVESQDDIVNWEK